MNVLAGYSASCWPTKTQAPWRLLYIFMFANAAASAMPLDGFDHQRRQSNGGQSNSGGLSSSVWVPIMVIAIAFVVLSLLACIKRSMNRELAVVRTTSTSNATTTPPTTDQTAPGRRRRRPRRTPSQISTKSLPPYMKEPGDHELVIYRGPAEMGDQSPNGMPTLGEVEENVDPSETHFNIPLDHMVTRDTLPDVSTAHLSRNLSRHTTGRSIDANSIDSSLQSHGSNVELLASHSRTVSNVTDSTDYRGEAPPYSEAVGGGVSTFSFPQPAALGPPGPQLVQDTPRSRFSFLLHPFVSRSNSVHRDTTTRAASTHSRSASAFSFQSSEHGSSTRPTTPSGSRSHLLRGTRTRSSSTGSGVVLTSPSMISLNTISAPLPHTLTRAEFRIPRGGLTPEQIKIITARDAPERFGRPYGPAAVAFADSRVMLTDTSGPPPGFEEVFGGSVAAGSGDGSPPESPNPSETMGNNYPSEVVDRAEIPGPIESGVSSTWSPSDTPPTSLSRQHAPTSDQEQESTRLRVDVRASLAKSFTITDSEEPMTPLTARPFDFVSAAQA